MNVRVLALQAYDTGSHRAFLDGWRKDSAHTFTVLALPGRHFKWRMRSAPLSFAKQVTTLAERGECWDVLWCTSMLDLAALRGLCPAVARLPTAVYFHENQLAYPTRYADQTRDLHFGLTNMTTALAALASCPGAVPCVWWNSGYNSDSFLDALMGILDAMPDERPAGVEGLIRSRSTVLYPGIDLPDTPPTRKDPLPGAGPTILWNARWEYDKRPEVFFAALEELDHRGFSFRLSVVGQAFAEQPGCFAAARKRFADRVLRWGYQPDRASYQTALDEADVVVSTAAHEFFGLAVAEAAATGCVPVVPEALAYPEVWGDTAAYHDNTPAGVADAIERAAASSPTAAADRARRYRWGHVVPALDAALSAVAGTAELD